MGGVTENEAMDQILKQIRHTYIQFEHHDTPPQALCFAARDTALVSMAVDPDQIAQASGAAKELHTITCTSLKCTHPCAQAFVAHYYASFDAEATRPTLAALYQPQSMLTFEGVKLQARLLVGAVGRACSAAGAVLGCVPRG